jgi:4-diphosphocytidyl-2-C-methyl-D-erythritol kinase
MRAARLFARETGWRGAARCALEKRTPVGAGLGGGSSDAIAALRALNQLAGGLLSATQLATLAALLGSDCALFLAGVPVVMRGRGEKIAPLPAEAVARLKRRRVLIFKPAFGIATPWAYTRMAAEPAAYLPAAEAEARLAAWIEAPAAPAEELLFNNVERVAFAKFVALPTLLDALRARFGLAPRMSGSGSACFALLPDDADVAAIAAAIRGAWGESALVREATFS